MIDFPGLLKESLEYRTFEEHVDRVELWIHDRLGEANSADMGYRPWLLFIC